jgi:hydroxypyruvate reductase
LNKRPRIISKRLLIRNGRTPEDRRARSLCLFALEKGLEAVDPAKAVHHWVRASRRRIRVGEFSMPIPARVVALAVGKASVSMLSSTFQILGERIVSAILVTAKVQSVPLVDKRVTIFRTAHPVPDAEGKRASRYIIESIQRMCPDELLLCLISGGASAMLPAPTADVALGDKQRITQRLIRSRASIHQLNTVRKHLSDLKGGRLVEHCTAGQIISLIVSDVPGNTLSDIGSGLTAPDPTTFLDAINVLREFDLWDSAPSSVRNHLRRGYLDRIPETPKPGDRMFRRVHNVIIADNGTACRAMSEALNGKHAYAKILTSAVDTDARALGSLLASMARDCGAYSGPRKKTSAVILGGETTVDVKGTGRGGRNQEVALAALEGIAGLKGLAIAALGTDGIDGNSPAAGALIDGQSMSHAIRLGLSARKVMNRNDSFTLFRKLRDSIVTGPTGTNVSDVYLLVRT